MQFYWSKEKKKIGQFALSSLLANSSGTVTFRSTVQELSTSWADSTVVLSAKVAKDKDTKYEPCLQQLFFVP